MLDDRLVLKVLKDEVVRNEQFVPLGNKEELAHVRPLLALACT